MTLFERLSRVARAEVNYAKSQSITPEEEMERAISQMRSTVIATQIAIGRVPASQAKLLKKRLALLESQLSEAEAKRDALLRRMRKAKERLQYKVNPSKSHFERMEEKVLEVEACAEAADELDHFVLVNVNDDLGEELEELKRQLLGVSVSQPTPSDTSENTTPSSKVDEELEALRKQIDNL
jgi:phage shock protein A